MITNRRRRRLILWSLGMGMVAAFVQSRLAAARAAEPPLPVADRYSLSGPSAVGEIGSTPLACYHWTDSLTAAKQFSRLMPRRGRATVP